MIDIFLSPLILSMLLLAALLVALVRRRAESGRIPLALCAAALLLLLASSSRPLSSGLLQLLESGQEHLDVTRARPPEAILVLGAGLRERRTPRPVLGDAGKERLLEGVRLARAYPDAFLVFSGGLRTPRGETSAEVMANWAVQTGIAPGRVVIEPRASTTHENAVEMAAIIRERGWSRLALVTSARHMPRALATFRALGLEPVPAPCDFTDAGGPRNWVLPDPRALLNTHRFLHEVVGHLWYRLRGWA